ncbi:MAG: hypothetical protein EA377_11055 [Phycisphaerales bacterium]|nr:MAG: hypothetical protein EA377_11055 [Phycisphaerales bacterium]
MNRQTATIPERADATVVAEPRCPRCGYQQRGIIETWREQCPLEGRCTECGLLFQWSDVLIERLPRWNNEYGTWQTYPRRTVRTIVLSFRPWKFWSGLQMHHEIQPKRLLLYPVVLALVSYLAIGIGTGIGLVLTMIAHAQDGITIQFPQALFAVLHAVVLPFSDHSYNFLSAPQWMWLTGESAAVISRRLLSAGPLSISLLFACAHVMAAACFALLPPSRRKAKVRWAHIVRAAVYGLGLIPIGIFLVLLIGLLTLVGDLIIGGVSDWWWSRRGPTGLAYLSAFCVLLLLHVMWWAFATSRYMKMPHAWGVGLTVMVIPLLILFLLLLPIFGHYLMLFI